MATTATIPAPRARAVRAVPVESQERFAATLTMRDRARQYGDALAAAPEHAKEGLKRAFHAAMNSEPVQLAKKGWIAGRSWIQRLFDRFGPVATVLSGIAAATSKKGQEVIHAVSSAVVSATKWIVDSAVSVVTTPLRWFGRIGNWFADRIEDARDWVYGACRSVWNSGWMKKLRKGLSHDNPKVQKVGAVARIGGAALAVAAVVPGPWSIPAAIAAGALAAPAPAREWVKGKAKEATDFFRTPETPVEKPKAKKNGKGKKANLTVVGVDAEALRADAKAARATYDAAEEMLKAAEQTLSDYDANVDAAVQAAEADKGPKVDDTAKAVNALRNEGSALVFNATQDWYFNRDTGKTYRTDELAANALSQKTLSGFRRVLGQTQRAKDAAMAFAVGVIAVYGKEALPADKDDLVFMEAISEGFDRAFSGQQAAASK